MSYRVTVHLKGRNRNIKSLTVHVVSGRVILPVSVGSGLMIFPGPHVFLISSKKNSVLAG